MGLCILLTLLGKVDIGGSPRELGSGFRVNTKLERSTLYPEWWMEPPREAEYQNKPHHELTSEVRVSLKLEHSKKLFVSHQNLGPSTQC